MEGLPLEIITLGVSSVLGLVGGIISNGVKARQATHNMLMESLAVKAKIVDKAREYSQKDKGFAFTRRIIALLAVGSVIVLPKALAIWQPELAVSVGYHEMQSGFFGWLFGFEKEGVEWVTQKGFVITPLDTHLVSAITGLYFGGSIAKNA